MLNPAHEPTMRPAVVCPSIALCRGQWTIKNYPALWQPRSDSLSCFLENWLAPRIAWEGCRSPRDRQSVDIVDKRPKQNRKDDHDRDPYQPTSECWNYHNCPPSVIQNKMGSLQFCPCVISWISDLRVVDPDSRNSLIQLCDGPRKSEVCRDSLRHTCGGRVVPLRHIL
jgi:hypothetical protein